jgi:peptidoglycan/LPS O-acetylase OafA/YrhL
MKLTYRPEIDGLRAIAVVAVIIYHAQINILGYQPFKGGFIGVDIFFVISGYLITSIILKELVTTGTFSFKHFYERRVRRILPVLLIVMLVSLPFAYMYLLPSSLIDFSKSILYSLGFSSNLYFNYSGQQYGAESALLKPFLHTWSLSVEEQYYILFPVILLIIFKYFRKHLIHILILGFIISLGLADWGSRNHPSFNFYVLPSRGWELLAGSILAYFEITLGHRSKNRAMNFILPSIGLILIAHSILYFNDKMFHPSLYTLSPIIGVCLIIWFSSKDELITKILSSKVFVGIGLISYSLYLWHYPIFAFGNFFAQGLTDIYLFQKRYLIAIIISFSLVSYHLIEKPFRQKQIKFKTIIVPIILTILIISTLNLYAVSKEGISSRFANSKFLEEIIENKQRSLTDEKGHPCFNNINGCEFNNNFNKKIFIIGDSLVNSISFDLNERLKIKDYSTSFFYIGDCLYFPKFDRIKINTKIVDDKCNQEYFQNIENKLLQNKDSIVIFFGRFTLQLTGKRFDNGEGGKEQDDLRWEHFLFNKDKLEKEDSFKKSIKKISKLNNIILLYPLPEVGWKLNKMIRNSSKIDLKINNLSTSYKIFKDRNKISFDFLDSIKNENIYRVYPHKLFCSSLVINRCITHDRTNILYQDSLHPSIAGSRMINDLIIKEIEKIELKSN